MPLVVVVNRSRRARADLRRGLALRLTGLKLTAARTAADAARLIGREVVDALVWDVRSGARDEFFRLIGRYPGIPMFALSSFRPDDGAALMSCRRAGLRGILVEGVDGAAAGEWVAARTASRRRQSVLRDAPGLLRLSEPLQRKAWDEVLNRVGARVTTAEIARVLGCTREHLSREFAAGGAPNLKRVIDLARICCAADLLANPGYDVAGVSRILRFTSPSHFSLASRRVAGVTPGELARIGPRQTFLRFLKGRTRSRL